MSLKRWFILVILLPVGCALAVVALPLFFVAGRHVARAAPDCVSGPAGLAAYYFDGSKGTLNLSDGRTWVITLTGIDGSAVTGNKTYHLLVQDHGTGSGWETLPTQTHHDFYGAGGHLLQSDDNGWTVRSSHGFNPGDVSGTYDLRVVMSQRTDDKWDISPYFRLPGGNWTLFYDGAWTTATAFDLTKTRIAVGIDAGGDGTLCFAAPTANAVDLTNVFVDDDWVGLPNGEEVLFPGDPNPHYIGLDAFATIQEGIDNVYGSTVDVAAGTYNEQVVIDTANLTLNGPNAGVDPGCSGTRPSAEATISWSTLTGVGTASTVVIAADDVTVDGFTIENTNGTQNQVSVLFGGHYVGDTTRPTDGSQVRNDIISSGYNNVYLWQSSDNTIERNRVRASVETEISIRDNAGQGTRDALRNSVLDNCIDKAGVASLGHSVAIGVTGGGAQDFTGTLIQGNTMKNSGAGTGHFRGIDANLANGTVAEPVRIYGNTITDTSEQGIRIESSNNYDIGGSSSSTGNTITGSRGAVGGYRRGIATAGTSTGLAIQYNTISGHSSTSGNDAEIVVTTTGNTILHNTLFVADSSPTGVGGLGLRLDNPSNVFGENTFQGNGQRMLQASGAPGPGLTVVDVTASTFKTAGGATLDPDSQADLVSIEDRLRHHMDVPSNLVLLVFKTSTTVATALNNATTPGAIQRAINAVPGSTVIVGPGTYNERVMVNKSVDLRGAQYGVDPTQPGARTNPANESTIDLTGLSVANPNVLVEIADGISNVAVAGFTLKGSPTFHYADEAVIRAWDNDIAIEDSIINGYIGLLYKGPGQNIDVLRNRVTFNKNGVIVQPGTANNVDVSDNVLTLGSTPGGDEAAIYMTGASQVSVTGNTATGVAPNGRGLYGSNLTQVTASGNTFTGNKDAISIFGSSTFITISDNNLSDSLRYGINIKGQDISITDNDISGCDDVGVNIDKHVLNTERVTVSGNDLSGSTNFGVKVNTALVTQIVNAEDNWWGSANGPVHASNSFNVGAQGVPVSDGADFVPWLNAAPPGGVSFAPVTTTSPVDSYASIQAGADGSNPGGTVDAKAGTFDEQVVISKGLTLQGAGDTTVIKPSSGAKLVTVLNGHYADGTKQVAGIVVANASGASVTMKNLKVDGDSITAKPAGADYVAGTFYRETGGIVDHLAVANVTVDATGTAVRAYGAYLSAVANTVSVELKGSTFMNYDKNGINAHGSKLTVNVHHNTLTGRGPLPEGDEVQNGVLVMDGAAGTVNANTVSNHVYTPETWWAAGILFYDSGGSASGNTLTNNQIGVVFDSSNGSASGNTVTGGKVGLYAQSYDPGTWTTSFTGNTVSGSDTAGIGGATYSPGASLAVSIANNSLTGGTGDGVAIGDVPEASPAGTVTATVTGNVISGWLRGVNLLSSATSSTSINFNTISGNTQFGVRNLLAFTVNAENNWWGTCSGPYHPTLNPSGTGNAASDNVDFDPWIHGGCDYDGDKLGDDQENLIGTDWQDPDTDGDGCDDGREYVAMPGYDPLAWYDVYDVPVPANADMAPNGPRNRVVDIGDVLAVLLYAFADDGGPPNANGLDYDSVKGSCDVGGDTVPDEEGMCYDRTTSAMPNPPWEAGPPNGVIDIADVLVALSQALTVDCSTGP